MRQYALTISYFKPNINDKYYLDRSKAYKEATQYVLDHPDTFKPSPYKGYYCTKSGDIFKVSPYGKVYKATNSEKSLNNAGYKIVNLFYDRKYHPKTLHSLIMETFVGPRPTYDDGKEMDIDHIDGNKLNNALDNLEYVTKSENMKRFYCRKFGIDWRN